MKHPNTYTATAPGSIMLFGEHTVLHGGQAIVTAIDQFIHVQLTPREDKTIMIHSDRLGTHQTTLSTLHPSKPFDYVLTAILQFSKKLTYGFDLEITAEFADNLGLGSSAAVSVAVIKVLAAWLTPHLSLDDIYHYSKQVILQVQGLGSAADVAASTYGETIAYRLAPLDIFVLPPPPEVTLVYCGYKTPTKIVIEHIARKQSQFPRLYAEIFGAMNSCTQDAVSAFRQHNWPQVGELMNIYQGLQEALGVSTPAINLLIAKLREQPHILGAKISGSGLGDCIWGLGALPNAVFPQTEAERQAGVQQLNVHIKSANFEDTNPKIINKKMTL